MKSTPRKASVKDSGIDPNNPYVNSNLDADLGKVLRGGELGKHKVNRKQINTSHFVIDAAQEEKDKSDR